jgi:hypothetical protein
MGKSLTKERTNLIFHSFGKRQVVPMSFFFATILVVIQATNNNYNRMGKRRDRKKNSY